MSQANDFGVNQDSIVGAPSDETADIKPSPLEETAQQRGLKIDRRYTLPGVHPFDTIEWEPRSSVIYNEKGEAIFEQNEVEVPSNWSQLAADIAVSKYFRKAGVPETDSETSVRQLIQRVAHTIRRTGDTFGGYFATPEDADAFEMELTGSARHAAGCVQFAGLV